jgi:phosphohistidine phosphatase
VAVEWGQVSPAARRSGGVKSLYLLRHAKSSWDDAGTSDHERPLAPRGHEAVRRLAAYLVETEVRPQLALCSSAVRARQTYEALATAFGNPELSVEDWLYRASSGEVLTKLTELPAATERVLLVGHNPVLGELAAGLAGEGGTGLLCQLKDNFPTGALAVLSFGAPWDALRPGLAYLESFVLPRDLPPTRT